MFFVLCSHVWFCLVVSCIWFPCLCIVSCCVLCFDFFMPLLSFSPWSSLCLLPFLLRVCLPLSVVLFPPCIPLVISPVGPPHLFLILSLVCVCLVCVFPALYVHSLHLFAPDFAAICGCRMFVFMLEFQSPCGMFWFWVFHVWFVLCLFLCTLLNCFILLLCLDVVLLLWFFCPGLFFFPCSLGFLLPSALI